MKRHVFPVSLSLALVLASFSSLHAQVGNQNPAGASGSFNGEVHTGCSYDPFTANTTRSVTDIAVAGAVGDYPLALVRTANSRSPSTTEVFGWSGGWNHNYNWIMTDSPTSTQANFQPTRYTVAFPDGRVETFKAVTWDPGYYRVRPGADTPAASTSSGVRERLQPQPRGPGYAYLILPDVGQIQFQAVEHSVNGTYYYKYTATAIIDPHGLSTSLTWVTTGNGTRRLVQAVDPSGLRSLSFYYVTTNGPRIDHVTSSDGRTVTYHYIYCSGCTLDQVSYYGNPNWIAHYQYCNSNIPGDNAPLLLWTCDDPMYPGPMKRIAYTYRIGNNADNTGPVYGQLYEERYWDGIQGHETSGHLVSRLTVGLPGNTHNARTETRGDLSTRTFIYTSGGYVTWVSDFNGKQSTMGYDSYKYLNSFIDFNRNETDYTCDPITGNITQIQFPFTSVDTQNQGNTRPTINYSYTNNYYLNTVTDEGNHTITIIPDGNNRVSQINYPDGGYETFSYDSNHFYQLQAHRMVTGGTETFTYNTRSLRDTYRNPDNVSGNPTARYNYDPYDRVSDVTDVLGSNPGDANHTTSFSYNLRGQLSVTTLPNDNGSRHTVTNYYNDDGTLRSQQNELYQSTQYTYDDYRRLKSVTPPVRGWGDNGNNTTYFYYGDNASDDPTDYKYADSNVTWVVLPSTKTSNIVYDNNRRRSSVTIGSGSEAAVTGYGYDNVGNLISITNPLGHNNVSTVYDERNRPWTITVGTQAPTTFKYDTAGRNNFIQRPNGQTITYDTFDAMNRVTQQTASNGTQNIITKYTYYTQLDGSNAPVGLLKTMQDPRLVWLNNGEVYTYTYDTMGRRRSVTYPTDSLGIRRIEYFVPDTAGRLSTYQNRNGNVQTFAYDALNRMTGFSWNDGGLTPSVGFVYDTASRLTGINNANATISRAYFNDNLLRQETETITGGRAKTVSYTYDADSNRASTAYPDIYTFNYSYTGRNQLSGINNFASFLYNTRGNLTTRTPANSTQSSYVYDSYDRVTRVQHNFTNNITRTVDYGYDANSNDRLWAKRTMIPTSPESNKGEVFSYDPADQVIASQLDVPTPDQVAQPLSRTITYDANGNRVSFQPPGWNEGYTINNLGQYTMRNSYNASYDAKGNLLTSPDSSSLTCTYDAQNRLLTASKNGSISVKYDGLNRQVSRSVNGGTPTFSVWDGWDLIEEYQAANQGAPTAMYLYGAGGLIAGTYNGQLYYYYQDGSGSTSHLADSSGFLKEWYRYDLQGAPTFYNSSDQPIGGSAFGVRHLFTGQKWHQDLGLYDLRNRFYSPDLGRFLQPDPIGFWGGNNLYQYCGNNPVTISDPNGEFANVVFGALVGAGVDLGIQLWSDGGDWGKVNWTEVGINAVAGGITSGASAFVGTAVTSTVARVAINVGINAAVGSASQVAINASRGDPLGKGAGMNAVLSGAAGVLSGLSGEAARRFEGLPAAALEAAAIALDNSSQFLSLFSGGSWSYQDQVGRIVVVGSPVSGSSVSPNISPTANYFGGKAGLLGGGSAWPTIIGSQSGNGYDPANYPAGQAPWAYGQGVVWGNAGGWNVQAANWQAIAQALAFASNTAGQGLVQPLFP